MISPDARSSGEIVSDALTRRQPVASGTSISSMTMTTSWRPRRRRAVNPRAGDGGELARTRSSCQTRYAD